MLDLSRYSCLGEALRDALERWPDEICLIEADRDRENCRLVDRLEDMISVIPELMADHTERSRLGRAARATQYTVGPQLEYRDSW